MDLERLPCQNLEELFECSKASWKRDKGVCPFADESLARMHGAGNVKLCNPVMRNLEIGQNLWNDSNHSATGSQRRLSDCLHQANIGTTIDDTDLAGGTGPAH